MNQQRAYSLIELMLVLTIIAAITTIAAHVYSRSKQKANLYIVESDLAKLANQLELYRQRHGTYDVNKQRFETAQLDLLTRHSPSHLPREKREFDLLILSASKFEYELKARPVKPSSRSVTLYSNGRLLWDMEER